MKTRAACLRAFKAALLSLTLLTAQEACAPRTEKAVPTGDAEIIVAAASNLSGAFDELGRKFAARTGTRITLSYGATGDLARQIENGAPFDVFAAADTRHVEELEQKGLMKSDASALYARGRVVLWTPQGSSSSNSSGGGSRPLERIEDLTDKRVSKIAVAKPEIAPYGQAAVDALRALHIWSEVEPKIVYAQNVSQAKQFASSGNADAAFIPRSLVKTGEGHFVEIDERLHRPIEQAIGIVSATKEETTARAFIAFVLSEEGQSLLESFGYERGTGAKKP